MRRAASAPGASTHSAGVSSGPPPDAPGPAAITGAIVVPAIAGEGAIQARISSMLASAGSWFSRSQVRARSSACDVIAPPRSPTAAGSHAHPPHDLVGQLHAHVEVVDRQELVVAVEARRLFGAQQAGDEAVGRDALRAQEAIVGAAGA